MSTLSIRKYPNSSVMREQCRIFWVTPRRKTKVETSFKNTHELNKIYILRTLNP